MNLSEIKFRVEDIYSEQEPRMRIPHGGIRVSLKQIAGLSKETYERIVDKRSVGDYRSLADFVARVNPDRMSWSN